MNIAKCCATCEHFSESNMGFMSTLFGKCELSEQKTNSCFVCDNFTKQIGFAESINDEIDDEGFLDIKSDEIDLEKIKNYILEGIDKTTSYSEYRMENYIINDLKEKIKNFFTSYKLEGEGYENALKDLIQINNILANRYEVTQYMGYSSAYDYNTIKEMRKSIEFLDNYKGRWNLDYFYEYHKTSHKKLREHFDEIEQKLFPNPEQEFAMEQERSKKKNEEKEAFIKRYYEKKVEFKEEDLDKYLKNEKFFSKKQVDEREITYPIILRLYKDKKLIFISKVRQNLMTRIDNYKKNKDFDDYSVSYVPENIIDDLYIEASIRFLIDTVPTNIVTMKSCGLYRTINQVKTRYKGDFNVGTIRKIVEKYNVPYFKFPSGAEVCHRDKFDKALKKFYDNKIQK